MSGPAVKILVVDDEPPIRRLLRTGLGTQGYSIAEVENAGQAQAHLKDDKADLVVLDLGLPDRNGLELLKDLRQAGIDVPVVVLSSRTDEAGIVQALELGADDYVTKPFSMNELIARIKVALRHRLQEQGEKPIFKVGDLQVDLVRRLVKLGENEVKLSPREYDILRTLVRHAGRVLTHQALLREVWGGIADVQNLRVHVRQLRQKIEPDPEQPRYILTETGVGYRLRAPE
jgi:two-component system KDP operon response regulator KdpE